MSYTIALVGNPNCGKTTLFNALTGESLETGNRSGVTVECREGHMKNRREVTLADLPGVCSLDAYTADEAAAKRYLEQSRPDMLLNVVDSSNLERSLELTLQLAALGIPMLSALTMLDEMKKRGGEIDISQMSEKLGFCVIPICVKTGEGLDKLRNTLVKGDFARAGSKPARSISVGSAAALAAEFYIKRPSDDIFTEKIDAAALGEKSAFPIFALVMSCVYFVSAGAVGGFLSAFIGRGLINGRLIPFVQAFMLNFGVSGPLVGFVCGGILGGVGAVVSFIPQMTLLFLFLGLLEECGYMARAAFITDRIFARAGLSGRTFVSMIASSGCAVPGIMSARTIEDADERRTAAMSVSFIPCGAKLPLVALTASMFSGASGVIFAAAYIIGAVSVFLCGIIMKRKCADRKRGVFLTELPPYRVPSMRSVFKSVRARVAAFVIKAGTVILLSSAFIWLCENFGIDGGGIYFGAAPQRSLLSYAGRLIAPLFRPLGWGEWQYAVAFIGGLFAKENVVGILAVLGKNGGAGYLLGGLSAPAALSFMFFNLLTIPCAAAV
ncbi:MAG: ferrous iron transporter B, partial [Eubacteriales bacterium]